jgi:hypothetical protein
MMLWDKLFWLWFVFSAALVIFLYLYEPGSPSIIFGLLLAGLGLSKLAEEAGKGILHKRLEKERQKEPKLRKALLKRLEK